MTRRVSAVITDSPAERSGRLQINPLAAVTAFADQSAVCQGHLIVVFEPEQSTAQALFQANAYLPVATTVAREHKSAALIASTVMPEVTTAVRRALSRPPPATEPLPSGRTLDAFEVAADDETDQSRPVDILVPSAMVVDTTTFNLNQRLATSEVATLACSTPVPNLHDDTVTVEGVGETNGPVPAVRLVGLRPSTTDTWRVTRAHTCTVIIQIPT